MCQALRQVLNISFSEHSMNQVVYKYILQMGQPYAEKLGSFFKSEDI